MSGYYDMGGDAYTSFTYGYSGSDPHAWDDRDDEADPETPDTTSKETT